jgi:hypothetical protein
MDFIIIFLYIYKSENHLISQKIGFFVIIKTKYDSISLRIQCQFLFNFRGRGNIFNYIQKLNLLQFKDTNIWCGIL